MARRAEVRRRRQARSRDEEEAALTPVPQKTVVCVNQNCDREGQPATVDAGVIAAPHVLFVFNGAHSCMTCGFDMQVVGQ